MRHSRRTSLLLLPVLAATLAAGAAASPPAGKVMASTETSSISRRQTGIDSSGDYRQELQACRSGRTQQAQETCLEEARNAHAASLRGELTRPGANYTANALARCLPLNGEYRAACEARVMGYGTTSGGVAGGGLLREIETVVEPAGTDRAPMTPRTHAPVPLVPAPAR